MAHHVTHDVLEVDHKELTRELSAAFEHRVALFVWGPPGIGKSYSANAASRATARKQKRIFVDWNRTPAPVRHALAEHGQIPAELLPTLRPSEENEALLKDTPGSVPLARVFIFADYRLAQRDASDLNGLPFPDQRNWVEWRPNLLFMVMSKPGLAGMLLLDEVPQALPIVQNAAFQMIQDRCCGELSFSDDVAIIAAGNRLTDGGTQYQIPPALANRFVHLELRPPKIEQFADWAIDHDVDGRIVAFLRFRPSFLMDDLDVVRKNRCMAWATPRSWEKASTMIRGVPVSSSDAVLAELYAKVAMAVGKTRAIEFRAFAKSTGDLDIQKLLSDPKQAKDLDLGVKWALISAVAEYYRSSKSRLNDILGLCEYLDADFAVSMLRMMRRTDKSQFATRLIKCANKGVALGYLKYFED